MNFKTTPYEHQEQVLNRIIAESHRNYQALFLEMGTGKTKISIDYVNYLKEKGLIDSVLLIAPNGVHTQWFNTEVPKHHYANYKRFLWNNKKSKGNAKDLADFLETEADNCTDYIPAPSKEKKTLLFHESVLTEKQVAEEKEIIDIFSEFEDLEEEGDTPLNNVMFQSDADKISEESKIEIVAEKIEEELFNDDEFWHGKKKEEIEKDKDNIKWFFVNVERFSTGDDKTFKPFSDYITNNKCLVIVDEATVIKNPNSKRTNNLTDLCKDADYKIILTGTPITNSPFDIYAMMNFLKPGFWGINFFMFKNRYGMFVKDSTGGRTFNREMSAKDINMVRGYLKKDVSVEETALRVGTSVKTIQYIVDNPDNNRPYKNLDKIKEIIAPVAVFLKKSDCKDINIPAKQYQVIELEMSKEQEKTYKQLKKNFIAEYEDKVLTVTNSLSMMIRLQQITGGFFPSVDEETEERISSMIGTSNVKIEYLKRDIGEAGELKIIIWARFVQEIELIQAELQKSFPNKRIEKYYGGTPQDVRDEYKQDFSEGLIDIMIINPQTGSMGLNLPAATLHYYYSNHRSIALRLQSEDRSHRIGQKNTVTYKDILMKNTLDVTILNALTEKKDLLEYFRDRKLEEII